MGHAATKETTMGTRTITEIRLQAGIRTALTMAVVFAFITQLAGLLG